VSKYPRRLESDADLIRFYDAVYRDTENHEKLDPYGSHDNRDHLFIDYIQKKLPQGGKILDASCGDGHLAKSLMERGYEVEVSEVSPWIIDRLHQTFPVVHDLTYAQLSRLPSRHYDAVCSNDVLEHLVDEEAAIEAIHELTRISNNLVLISVGIGPGSRRYLRQLGVKGIETFHLVRSTPEWWREKIAEVIEIDDQVQVDWERAEFIFGKRL
jgi:hypothetical protein